MINLLIAIGFKTNVLDKL